jgi:hypothetical protein
VSATAFAGRTGMTHLVEGRAPIARGVRALCGRTVYSVATWGAEATESIRADHARLNRTHVTNTCRGCFR